MLLGKRPRLPIKRTTSMTGIRVDLDGVELEEPSDDLQHPNGHDLHATVGPEAQVVVTRNTMMNYSALVSPRNVGNQSGRDLVRPTSDHFLRTCGLCRRRLAPGRDIYMYRGDTAFCSLECREKQIKQDERKEEYAAVGSKKKDDRHASSSTAGTRGSRKGQTVAAA